MPFHEAEYVSYPMNGDRELEMRALNSDPLKRWIEENVLITEPINGGLIRNSIDVQKASPRLQAKAWFDWNGEPVTITQWPRLGEGVVALTNYVRMSEGVAVIITEEGAGEKLLEFVPGGIC